MPNKEFEQSIIDIINDKDKFKEKLLEAMKDDDVKQFIINIINESK